MEYSSQINGSACIISFNGQMTFSDNDTIRTVISEIEGGDFTSCSIDLSELTSIDSAGLGMLLLINDASTDCGKSLEISGAAGQVEKMLEISKFGEVLTIR